MTLFILWLVACAADERGELVLREAEVQSPGAPATAATRQRGRVIGGERVARAITWPAEHNVATAARDRYDAPTREAIARSPVPVLAPSVIFEHATLSVGAHWYALSVHGEGWTLRVDGSGEARSYPHLKTFERTHPMRAGDGFFTRNEGVWSATWIEHGAAYSFEVECTAGAGAWCEDEAAVLAELERLVYLGGKQVRS
ncbi:MAG: hypothetical protein IAG13_35780 [Deltaproteobacteria bacterium]|nr:hypothetical protein [Nannocystaceae bacterium]